MLVGMIGRNLNACPRCNKQARTRRPVNTLGQTHGCPEWPPLSGCLQISALALPPHPQLTLTPGPDAELRLPLPRGGQSHKHWRSGASSPSPHRMRKAPGGSSLAPRFAPPLPQPPPEEVLAPTSPFAPFHTLLHLNCTADVHEIGPGQASAGAMLLVLLLAAPLSQAAKPQGVIQVSRTGRW